MDGDSNELMCTKTLPRRLLKISDSTDEKNLFKNSSRESLLVLEAMAQRQRAGSV